MNSDGNTEVIIDFGENDCFEACSASQFTNVKVSDNYDKEVSYELSFEFPDHCYELDENGNVPTDQFEM